MVLMPIINYPNTSPYAATPQTPSHIGVYRHRDIPAANDDRTIVIDPKYNLRPDLLAYDLYGNPQYWWVFLVRNIDFIRDPIWDFKTGLEIVVPSNRHLRATLG